MRSGSRPGRYYADVWFYSFFYIGVTRERVSGTKMWSNPYTIDNQYCCTGGVATTGSLTKWIRDEMAKELVAQEEAGGENAYTALFERGRKYPSRKRWTYYTSVFFRGKECRFQDPMAKGVFFGLNLQHTRGHIVHAALLKELGMGLLRIFSCSQMQEYRLAVLLLCRRRYKVSYFGYRW